MAAPRRTQKQIAERYKANLGYYKKKHPWRRARFLVSCLAIVGGIIGIVFFQMRGGETFFNPGKISSSHARFANDCAQCHDKSLISAGTLTPSTFNAVLRERFHYGVAFEPIDRKCETCHLKQDGRTHTFHQANVVQDRSCSACHQEHQGSGPLKLVASSNCLSCHGNSEVMQASAQKGMQLPSEAFKHNRWPSSCQDLVVVTRKGFHHFGMGIRNFSSSVSKFAIPICSASIISGILRRTFHL